MTLPFDFNVANAITIIITYELSDRDTLPKGDSDAQLQSLLIIWRNQKPMRKA